MNKYKLLKHYVEVNFNMYSLAKFAKKLMEYSEKDLKAFENISLGNRNGIKGENYWYKKVILSYIDRMENDGTEITPAILAKKFNLNYVAKHDKTPPEIVN